MYKVRHCWLSKRFTNELSAFNLISGKWLCFPCCTWIQKIQAFASWAFYERRLLGERFLRWVINLFFPSFNVTWRGTYIVDLRSSASVNPYIKFKLMELSIKLYQTFHHTVIELLKFLSLLCSFALIFG